MSTALVVDDKQENLYLLQALLAGNGFSVACASDGAEALACARTSPPDIIVSDILMPGMDGFALCREWRRDPALRQIPFVFYTATYRDPRDERLALDMGADRFLVKPLEPDVLLAEIRAALAKPRESAGGSLEPSPEAETVVMREYNQALVRKLEDKLTQLETALRQRDESERRLDHLNRVLGAIRSVNQLIVRERRSRELIEASCAILTATKGFTAAWIVVPDGGQGEVLAAHQGVDRPAFERIVGDSRRGEWPPCVHRGEPVPATAGLASRAAACESCPLAEAQGGRLTVAVRLTHGGRFYGCLGVSVAAEFADAEQESLLIEEVAGDIAFALHTIAAEAERAKLQAQLNQAQKMESVGRLAGGVAHDFNNMLGVILGHAELGLEGISEDQPLFEDLTEIRDAARRSADLTRQLLAFARKQTIAPKVLDLNETVAGMLRMLGRLIREDIDLAWVPGRDLWLVLVDPSQIDQILANLCVNARDAIQGTGKVTIETSNVVFDDDHCANHVGFFPGEFVLLAVSDDGCGMGKEVMDRLFEPFFTTKEVGKGTGLGLATVYGIVKQNNGFINVYSEPGQGTTFRIYLPRHAVAGARVREEAPTEPPPRGNECILLVEDESAILRMATVMLERQGYTVLAASRPSEAIRLAEEHPGDIQLLMTDVVMPEMDGRELAARIGARHPGVKLLFMSGYMANSLTHRSILEAGAQFIGKPFSMNELWTAVRKALGTGG